MKTFNKKRKRKHKVKEQEPKSMIGKIVDLPLEDFERELVEQKVNIGTINNLILNLEGAYYELRTRKDAIVKILTDPNTPSTEKDCLNKALNGLYAEMIKTEQKITYLKQRSKELSDVG